MKKIKKKTLIIIFSIIAVLIIFAVFYFIKTNHVCNPGEKRCNSNNLESCTNDGRGWAGIDVCEFGCLNGVCKLENQVCEPGSKVCVGTNLNQCSSLGDGYFTNKQCGVIEGGICKDFDCVYPASCNEGEKKCEGNIVKICTKGPVINLWTNFEYCLGQCSNSNCVPSGTPLQVYSPEYDTLRKSAGISDKYLAETWAYDYTKLYQNPKVIELKQSLQGLSVTEAVRKIAIFTAENVYYNTSVMTREYCVENSASMILNKGSGVCSTMSRVNIALLRGIGIPARNSVGCAVSLSRCSSLAVTTSKQGFPLPTNKALEDSRIVFGGGPHAWVEVWLPEYGWTILESIYGLLYPTDCVAYDEYANEDNFNQNIDACSMSYNIGYQCLSWQGY